jgi:ribokinase
MKILNFGSLNIDHVYQMDHFVAAGETEHSFAYDRHMGGKGLNQSVALARAGAEVWHAGCVGADGAHLTAYLAEAGVHTDYLKTVDVPTGHAIIQVEKSGQNCIILFGGANQAVTPAQAAETLAHFEKGDILLLQNEISALGDLIRLAHARGMRIALNPSPATESLTQLPLNMVEWFILNEVEGEQLTGQTDPVTITGSLLARYPGCRVVLTLGKRGVMYRDEFVCRVHGIYDVPVVDTTAAGDTFTGFFLAGAAQGLPVEMLLENASKASSIAITRPGAAQSIPTMEEVKTTEMVLVNYFR